MGFGAYLKLKMFSMGYGRGEILRPLGSDVSICLLLTVINLIVFGNVGQFDFVFDDTHYVTGNVHFRDGITMENVFWALTTTHAGFYHPLTWLSLLVDAQLYGFSPGGYHWTNLLFHIASTLLLFFFLRRATGAVFRSGLVAALFAVHPLHVESVAWVAARKDVLSAFFWMLTMGVYTTYSEHPDLKRYILVVLCFILGLMSKPMLVTLPFVLLLLDYWPLRRINFSADDRWALPLKLIWEKVPLVVLSILFSVITIYTERNFGAFSASASIPLQARLVNALISYAEYIRKLVWPFDLAVFYPYASQHNLSRIVLSGIVLLGISAFVAMQWRKRPHLSVGWLWYLGTLVPVIGIIQVGFHSMADRYTYIPLIGLFIMIVWGVNDLLPLGGRTYRQLIVTVLSLVLLVSIMFCGWFQVQHWKDSYSLFTHALCVTKDNHLAHSNLGVALKDSGRYGEAMFHFQEAVRIRPNYTIAHDNLGCVYVLMGKPDEAIPHFRKALSINPRYRRAQKNLACALLLNKELGEAISLYRKIIMVEPEDPELYNNLGAALVGQGKFEEAMSCFEMALKKDPNYKQALSNRLVVGKQINK